MEDTHQIAPHILRVEVESEGEAVLNAPMVDEGRRGLLVFTSYEQAAEFAAETDVEALEPTPVTPEDIEAFCANHGYALVGFLGLEGEGEVSVFSSEVVPEIFEAVE
jgi:hypothetical protein